MAMEAADIERLIRDAFPDATVEIRDLAGDGAFPGFAAHADVDGGHLAARGVR